MAWSGFQTVVNAPLVVSESVSGEMLANTAFIFAKIFNLFYFKKLSDSVNC